jgi:toxin ParE1/3/4
VKYQVILTPQGEEGLLQGFQYIFERAPLAGIRWLRGFYRAIDSLESFPERCPFAPERLFLEEDLRHLIFKSHRIIFQVNKQRKEVHILEVRHGRRRAIGELPDELRNADDE